MDDKLQPANHKRYAAERGTTTSGRKNTTGSEEGEASGEGQLGLVRGGVRAPFAEVGFRALLRTKRGRAFGIAP